MTESPAAANAVGSGKATLRLRSKGPPVVETEEVSLFSVLVIFVTLGVKSVKKTISFPQ